MKKNGFYLLILIFAVSAILCCSQKQLIEHVVEEKPQKVSEESEKLIKFFRVCESDIQEAVKVIADYKMSGMLTHLKEMDNGGRKYYLLEREHLTEMIKAVTKNTYSDLILINNKGVIIYTMTNDDIFGKHVKYHLKDTALEKCFNNSANGLYIADFSNFPQGERATKLFAAFPDKNNDYVRGIFIIQINIEIIEALFEKKTTIIGRDGNYRLDSDKDNIFQPYKYFYKIDFIKLNRTEKEYFEAENKRFIYYPFNYNTLSWIIISEN